MRQVHVVEQLGTPRDLVRALELPERLIEATLFVERLPELKATSGFPLDGRLGLSDLDFLDRFFRRDIGGRRFVLRGRRARNDGARQERSPQTAPPGHRRPPYH